MKKKGKEAGEPYKVIRATREKGLTSEFLLSYILPLFAFDFKEWQSVVLFVVYFCTLAFLCIRNDNVYANLILEFQRYIFYSCEVEYAAREGESKTVVVISKQPLASQKGNIQITALNKPFYLECYKSIFCDEETS